MSVAFVKLTEAAGSALAATDPPAGGSPLGEVIAATAAATIVVVGLLAVGLARRAGRAGLIAPAEAAAARALRVPGWSALPVLIAAVSLVGALVGLYWDISLHLDHGRDDGPLANPSHFLILGGLLGIFAAGWLAVVMPIRGAGPAAIRIGDGWQAPIGGLAMMACASFAALGFPLDDLWHRLFGQDVTLWGPTHLMMLTGAALSLVGILVLIVEGRLARAGAPGGASDLGATGGPPLGPTTPARIKRPFARASSSRLQYVLATGGVLAGLSIYQGEFDFGVPQFALLYHPLLVALAGSVALVVARLLAGPGGALGAVAFFLILRGAIALLVGPILGQSLPHFPLYLGAALAVEAVAWRLGTERPYRFAIAAGAAVGTVGILSELGWSHLWMPIPWPAHAIGEAFAVALPVAIAGGVLGAFVASALQLRRGAGGIRPALAAAGALGVVAATIAVLLPTSVPSGARADVSLRVADGGPGRWVEATVRVAPPGLADGADWLHVLAWQGGDRVVAAPLERIGDDTYRTTEPLPVDGTWKSVIRVHRGDLMGAIGVYAPADAAIPAPEVPAPPRFERAFVDDRTLLQRERRDDAPGWAWTTASLTVLALGLGLLALLGAALRRLAVSGEDITSATSGAGATAGEGPRKRRRKPLIPTGSGLR